MRFLTALAVAGSIKSALSQNMSSASLCDKYTTALLMNNTAKNQYTLLTLLVNTVVIGNYTQPNKNAVPGILAKGMYNNVSVNLLPYFNGELASTNRGGSSGVSVNFLDDGGAVPLMMNKPANGTSSNQYFLLTHLYQFFGKLLGCSEYGTMDFPKYGGGPMYKVHAFMDLDQNQIGYFITQVGLAAASFGVSADDITTVATALNKLFNYRCSPAATVIPDQGMTLNSICINSTCPIDPSGSNCSAYMNAVAPMKANTTGSSMMPSGTGSSMMPSGTSAASGLVMSLQVLTVGLAFALLL